MDAPPPAVPWPSHDTETVAWQQRVRGGTRDDRTLRSIHTTIPPLIAGLDYMPPLPVWIMTEKALLASRDVDTQVGAHSAALGRFLIRSESVASSKIERISASARDYAKAIGGSRSNPSATSMVAASRALHALVSRVGERGRFELGDLTDAHRALLVDDPSEAGYAGRLRDMQNWIGGSDYSPRGALHVPPTPDRVPDLMDDLVTYLNRDDVPVMVQAAIGHAQFESIHAFTDGNGRIGRALVSAVLRRRGVTPNTVVPLASGLLATRDAYFTSLGAYRGGDPAPIIALFAQSARVAAECSRATIARLALIPQEWRTHLAPRAGSAAAKLIDAFWDHPVLSAEEIEAAFSVAASQVYRAIDQLVEAGLIEEITGRKRNRVWAASEIMAELDDLDRRIHVSMRAAAL